MDRREFLACGTTGLIASALAPLVRASELLPRKGRRVVVIGGGFGGATAARYLALIDPTLEVVLIERSERYVCCPFSNLVLSGVTALERLTLDHARLAQRHGVILLRQEVTGIDPVARRVSTAEGWLGYERLVLAPGVEFRHQEIEGYDPVRTPLALPHAWKAGPQTLLLRGQIEAMRDGGTVVVAIPASPYVCPPGPYERVCQIALHLKRTKPKSKILVLDANPGIVTKGALFRQAWDEFYRGMVEYRPDQAVRRVDAGARTLHTEFDAVAGDVLNLIPPQQAGAIARRAGLAAPDGRWCPVEPLSFESRLAPGVHVIGDACAAGAMPKSAFAANTQAKGAAHNIAALLAGREAVPHTPINACYSFVTDREAMSVSAVYRPRDGELAAVPGSAGVSPRYTEAEGDHARSWLANLLADSFG